MYTIVFARGFIYGSCAVIFGWLIHQLSGIKWWKGIVLVMVIDLLIRAILNAVARKYLARHKVHWKTELNFQAVKDPVRCTDPNCPSAGKIHHHGAS
jgi:hypothetical protein